MFDTPCHPWGFKNFLKIPLPLLRRVLGEYILNWVARDLEKQTVRGTRLQKKLDASRNVDRKKEIAKVEHCGEWDQELKGWQERMSIHKKR